MHKEFTLYLSRNITHHKTIKLDIILSLNNEHGETIAETP